MVVIYAKICIVMVSTVLWCCVQNITGVHTMKHHRVNSENNFMEGDTNFWNDLTTHFTGYSSTDIQ